jgi:hypothetical protein
MYVRGSAGKSNVKQTNRHSQCLTHDNLHVLSNRIICLPSPLLIEDNNSRYLQHPAMGNTRIIKEDSSMHRQCRILVVFAIFAVCLFAVSCASKEQEQEIVDVLVPSATPSPTASPTPPPPPEPVDENAPFGSFFRRLEVSAEQYAALPDSAIQSDETNDLFDLMTGGAAVNMPPDADIIHTLAMSINLTSDSAAWLSDVLFPCDGETTYCDGDQPISAGETYVLGMELAGDVPEQGNREYAFLMPISEGNYVGYATFDIFAGTNYWYLLSNFGSGLHLERIDAASSYDKTPTSARIIVTDDEIVALIPASEVAAPTGLRFATGALNVADQWPTDIFPMTPSINVPIDLQPMVHLGFPCTPYTEGLIEGYTIGGTCPVPRDRDGYVSCGGSGICLSDGGSRQCVLASRKLDAAEQDPASYRFEGAPGAYTERIAKEDDRKYYCLCVNVK